VKNGIAACRNCVREFPEARVSRIVDLAATSRINVGTTVSAAVVA